MNKVIVCDENMHVCEHISKILGGYYGAEIYVKQCSNPEELLQSDCFRCKCGMILIISVEAGNGRGIAYASKLQKVYGKLKVIFLADQVHRISDIFQAEPSSFLVKPLDDSKLIEAVENAVAELRECQENYIGVLAENQILKVNARDVIYCESEKRIVTVHARENSWKMYKKLDEIQKELPDYFVRTHKSYLVNMNDIAGIRQLGVDLLHGRNIPISRSRYEEVNKIYNMFIGK